MNVKNSMKNYVFEHIDTFKKICMKNKIDYSKLLKCAKGYNEEVIMFLYHDPNSEKSKLGLADEEPAKILATVSRDGETMHIEFAEDINKYI